MVKQFKIEATEDNPYINFDFEKSILSFEKTSMPENPKLFFEPIIKIINEYVQKPNEETIVNFKMDYFNTSSAKYIYDIILILKEIPKNGKSLICNWYFADSDNDMFDAGQNFSKMLNLPFNFVVYN